MGFTRAGQQPRRDDGDDTQVIAVVDEAAPEPSSLDGVVGVKEILEESASASGAPRTWGGKRERVAQKQKRNFRRVRDFIAVVVLVLLTGTGGLMVWQGMQQRELPAPLPAQSQMATPGQRDVGADGRDKVKISNADDGSGPEGMGDGSGQGDRPDGYGGGADREVSVDTMANLSLFLPEIASYTPLVPTNDFVPNPGHRGMTTIALPKNPRRASWHSTSPLVGGDKGTTLIAGHVASHSQWGSLRYLYKTKPGNVVWTKDAAGKTQKWQVKQVYYVDQTAFPQELWKADGKRQLAIVTCGGLSRAGIYTQNVIVIAELSS